MGIEYFMDCDDHTIHINTPKDLYESLDTFHTQLLDNNGDGKLMKFIENVIDMMESEFELD